MGKLYIFKVIDLVSFNVISHITHEACCHNEDKEHIHLPQKFLVSLRKFSSFFDLVSTIMFNDDFTFSTIMLNGFIQYVLLWIHLHNFDLCSPFLIISFFG